MMKNGYNSSSSANGGTEFWNNTYKNYIRTITFENDLSNLPSNCTSENLCWDVSYSSTQNKKVYGYLVDSGLTVSETDSSTSTTTEKTLYNLYIVSDAPIFAPTDCLKIFSDFSNLKTINFNNNFNTSKVTNMSGMFSGCSSLTSLDLSSFNTSNVKYFGYGGRSDNGMFANCLSLTLLDLSSFNTSQVTDMNSMFNGCSSLTSMNLSSFNTSKVTNMWYMFQRCSSLTRLDLSSFNTSNVKFMGGSYSSDGMFSRCSSLTSLDLSNFNTSSVTNMNYMFSDCSSLTQLNLSNFNTSKVTNMKEMFSYCSKLQTQINIMNAGINTYSYMFRSALTDPDAYVIIGYTTETQSIAEAMKSTAGSSSSKITLKQI